MIRSTLARLGGLFLTTTVFGACSLLAPYDQTFMCSSTDDYGRCIGVEQAYDEAIGGAAPAPAVTATTLDPAEREVGYAPPPATFGATLDSARNSYKAAEYREMQKLIEQPVTPLVKPPKVLRTLIVAYPAGTTTLFSPRYIWYFANDGRFVIGDYLNQEVSGPSDALTPFNGPR